jgi:hypothetical protein
MTLLQIWLAILPLIGSVGTLVLMALVLRRVLASGGTAAIQTELVSDINATAEALSDLSAREVDDRAAIRQILQRAVALAERVDAIDAKLSTLIAAFERAAPSDICARCPLWQQRGAA